jgi:mono/diheme cytochrome c family protein
MPRLFLSKDEARDAAAFIDSRLRSGDAGELAATGDATRGAAIYREKACRACHQIGAEGGALGPELTRAGMRLKPEAAVDLLLDPRRFVPATPKPDIGLTQREAEHIAAYLATLGVPKKEEDE